MKKNIDCLQNSTRPKGVNNVLRRPLHLLWTEFLVNLPVIIIKFAEGEKGAWSKNDSVTVSGEQIKQLKLGHLFQLHPVDLFSTTTV